MMQTTNNNPQKIQKLIIQIQLNRQQSSRIISQMQPTVLKIRPQISCPGITLANIMQYPLLQKRINDQKYELTGIHNLIVQLKKQTIQQLKEQFICNNNSVDLHQFMWLISNSVMVKAGSSQPKTIQQQYYQYQIEYQIVKVFQDIDIDNSNSISWQQYIQYITSSSLMQINQNTSQNPLTTTTTKQLQYSFKQKTIFRKNQILKIIQIQRLGLLAIIEKKIQNLSFITINGAIPIKNILLSGVDHNKVLSIDYSQDERMFGVLMSYHSVVFVQDCQLPKVIVDNKFVGNQIQIMYLRKHKLWLLISLDGTLQIFTPQKSRKKSTSHPSQKKLLKFKPHIDQLISIHQLHNPLSLVSSGWNGSIKIWSLTINQLLVQLNPNKEDDFLDCKAIKGVQVFNYKCISYIICWMYTTQISVWLPSSSITKPYLGKLVGHMGIVQEAKFLTNFPIVVSIDNKCSIRVWDVSKMQCIQSWKMDSTTNLKIFTLRSAPYILLYDKLIHYYKSSKQQGLIEYNNQIRSSSSVVVNKKTRDETNTKQKNEKPKIRSNSIRMEDIEQRDKSKSMNMNNNSMNNKINMEGKNRIQEDNENQKKININSNINNINNNSNLSNSHSNADITDNNDQAKYQQFQYYGKTHQKCTNVIALIYDSYLDVVVILTPDAVSIVAINTGHLLFKSYIQNPNQSFVAICTKENRRFFVANTQAEVLFYKTEDCSIQYKIYPFKENAERDREKAKIAQQNSSTELKSQKVVQKLKKLTSDHTVLALDYNIYNKVLMVVGESENNSVIVTFDNFSQFQPMKKKQIIFDQPNICSFASAQKYNIFYIGSNKPQTITIWDYHNFIILRSVAMPLPIQHLSCQTDKFNLLTVVQSTGIRIIKVQPVENKNNTRGVEINLFSKQMVIRNIKKVKKAYIIYRKVEMEQTVKKNKVKFEEDEASQQQQIQARKKPFHIYIISDSTVMLYLLDQISTYFTECPQPFHCDKANITKEVKYFNVSPTPCLAASQAIESGTITKVNISGGRKNVDIIGVIHNILYFQSIQGVLSFYKPDEGKVWSRLSMPKCSVIQWNVFFNLANKIVARLKKAEKISKETYAFKRKQKVNEQKKQYLRKCFLLNKYFSFEDINELNDLYSGKQTAKRRQKYKKKITEQDQKFQLKQDYMDQNDEQKKSYFEHKFVQRYFNGAQAAQKIKSLQTMYSKVFNYIKQKRATATPQQPPQPQPSNKSRCFSASKLAPDNKLSSNTLHIQRNQSNSLFKIKNTVSSANKIYFEHTKEIKACLNKIGILNNKIKGLKL